ncbi:hypothetical protein [Roseibium sp.]|uniref:hypothetical protein n=1 Tax=Roseibium sp. TaxID=1936156 RepID=UPI003BAFEA2F
MTSKQRGNSAPVWQRRRRQEIAGQLKKNLFLINVMPRSAGKELTCGQQHTTVGAAGLCVFASGGESWHRRVETLGLAHETRLQKTKDRTTGWTDTLQIEAKALACC